MNYAGSRPVAFSKTWMLCGALWASFSIGICSVAAADPTGNARFVVKELALPGANGLVSLDYFIFDPASHRLWVPASNTGSVDINTNQVSALAGFPTAAGGIQRQAPRVWAELRNIGRWCGLRRQPRKFDNVRDRRPRTQNR